MTGCFKEMNGEKNKGEIKREGRGRLETLKDYRKERMLFDSVADNLNFWKKKAVMAKKVLKDSPDKSRQWEIERRVAEIERELDRMIKVLAKRFVNATDCISGLSPVEEAVVRYFYLEGYTVREVAGKVNYSERHVDRILRTARGKLSARDEVAPKPPPDETEKAFLFVGVGMIN
jgi:uncharacterized protein Yka (UPF0111/DUF47 family)